MNAVEIHGSLATIHILAFGFRGHLRLDISKACSKWMKASPPLGQAKLTSYSRRENLFFASVEDLALRFWKPSATQAGVDNWDI